MMMNKERQRRTDNKRGRKPKERRKEKLRGKGKC
jgi:hypothetical protein